MDFHRTLNTFFVSLLSVCLFWFDFFPSVERLISVFRKRFHRSGLAGRRSLRCPTMWIHPSTHHPHTLARPSTNDKKGFFFSSSPSEIRVLGCVRDWMLFYYQRTRLSPSACFQFLCVDFFRARIWRLFLNLSLRIARLARADDLWKLIMTCPGCCWHCYRRLVTMWRSDERDWKATVGTRRVMKFLIRFSEVIYPQVICWCDA